MDKTCTGSLGSRSDEELLAEAQRGDSRAFEVLFRRHRGTAIGLAARICGRGQAEDAVQIAFFSVWRNLSGYRPGRGTVRTWLLAAVRNRSIDLMREQGRRPRGVSAPFELEDPERTDTVVVRREESRILRDALGTLPEAQSQVIKLAYFAELSHSEIASTLGVPIGTVKGRTRLGLQKLPARIAPALLDAA